MLSIFKRKPALAERISGPYKCSVCKEHLGHFNGLPEDYLKLYDQYQCIHSPFTFETLNVFKYFCTKCGASDRDRLYALFLERKFSDSEQTKPLALIDFAPSASLAPFLKSFPFLKYRSADLYMENVDDKVDLTDMKIYYNDSFDVFICSHLLEHIEDDRKAIRELYRILKPGGFGIVMAPISTILKEDYENASVTTPEGRWTHFAQDDHVRVYSKNGFMNKIKEEGFSLLALGEEFFGKDTFQKYGIHERSMLYIAEKK